jgi:ERCC4-type nuclease
MFFYFQYRLKESGIPNVIYMIENYSKNYNGAIPISSLFQAAMNTLVQDNFSVKFTKDHKDSLRYLSIMTTMLTEIYEVYKIQLRNLIDFVLYLKNIFYVMISRRRN